MLEGHVVVLPLFPVLHHPLPDDAVQPLDKQRDLTRRGLDKDRHPLHGPGEVQGLLLSHASLDSERLMVNL